MGGCDFCQAMSIDSKSENCTVNQFNRTKMWYLKIDLPEVHCCRGALCFFSEGMLS